MDNNYEMNENDKKNISKFIRLFLQMLMRGFDEMEMQKRLELVKAFGSILEFYFIKTYSRIDDLENRINSLETKNIKKK